MNYEAPRCIPPQRAGGEAEGYDTEGKKEKQLIMSYIKEKHSHYLSLVL